MAEHRGRDLLELVHSDVCGPITPSFIGGNRFYVTFVDDFSRKTWVYLLKHKSEVFGYFKTWKWKVEKQSGKKIKCLRTDRGGEYLSREYKAFLEKEGIDHQVTMAGTKSPSSVGEVGAPLGEVEEGHLPEVEEVQEVEGPLVEELVTNVGKLDIG